MKTSLKLGMVLNLNTPFGVRIPTLLSANLFADWPLGESAGTNADDKSASGADGTYTGGFTLNQPGIGDGSPSVLLNGSTGFVSIPAAATLDTPFNGAAGTMLLFAKAANADVWTNGAIGNLFALGADGNNRAFIYKNSTNNQMVFLYAANGVFNIVTHTMSPVTFFSAGMTWDKAGDAMKAFVNGTQVGATQTGLGVWAGALADGYSAIGSSSSLGVFEPFAGYVAHVAAWNAVLTAAQMAYLGAL